MSFFVCSGLLLSRWRIKQKSYEDRNSLAATWLRKPECLDRLGGPGSHLLGPDWREQKRKEQMERVSFALLSPCCLHVLSAALRNEILSGSFFFFFFPVYGSALSLSSNKLRPQGLILWQIKILKYDYYRLLLQIRCFAQRN